jgi:hypothetical protein
MASNPGAPVSAKGGMTGLTLPPGGADGDELACRFGKRKAARHPGYGDAVEVAFEKIGEAGR